MNRILPMGLTCAAIFLAPLIASAADVSDGAGFFSAEALTKANTAIHDIEGKTGHQVRIETFAVVPDGKSDAVSKMSKSEREAFFVNWEHDRIESTKSRGLYILICKSPAHVRIWAGNPLQLAGFHETQARAIREPLIKDLKAKEYDKALADTVAQATTIFAGLKPAHHGVSSAAPVATPHHTPQPIQHVAHAAPQAGFGGIIWVIIIIVGGVMLFSLITRMFSGGGGYGQPGYGGPGMGYGGGGGGFMQSLAGGIFGAVAGNWLYNQFAGPHASAGEGNWNHPEAPAANDADNTDGGYTGGTDFGGGDFGDDGGGDVGGGDFGGGDSGGSDFGGGGDF